MLDVLDVATSLERRDTGLGAAGPEEPLTTCGLIVWREAAEVAPRGGAGAAGAAFTLTWRTGGSVGGRCGESGAASEALRLLPMTLALVMRGGSCSSGSARRADDNTDDE